MTAHTIINLLYGTLFRSSEYPRFKKDFLRDPENKMRFLIFLIHRFSSYIWVTNNSEYKFIAWTVFYILKTVRKSMEYILSICFFWVGGHLFYALKLNGYFKIEILREEIFHRFFELRMSSLKYLSNFNASTKQPSKYHRENAINWVLL